MGKVEMVEEIKNRLSYDDEPSVAKDVAEYGADAGFGGFTQTTDCVEFYEQFEEEIWEMLRESADNLGESVPGMIANFGRADMADDADGFKNLLAWFALEEVCRELAENPETTVRLYGLYTDGSGTRVDLSLVEDEVDSLLPAGQYCEVQEDHVTVENIDPEDLELLLSTYEDEDGNEYTIEKEEA